MKVNSRELGGRCGCGYDLLSMGFLKKSLGILEVDGTLTMERGRSRLFALMGFL